MAKASASRNRIPQHTPSYPRISPYLPYKYPSNPINILLQFIYSHHIPMVQHIPNQVTIISPYRSNPLNMLLSSHISLSYSHHIPMKSPSSHHLPTIFPWNHRGSHPEACVAAGWRPWPHQAFARTCRPRSQNEAVEVNILIWIIYGWWWLMMVNIWIIVVNIWIIVVNIWLMYG